ncbi:hypothetical protein DPMN_051362 [Dreissena polymorpha]|uniref:Uncharacterized protein n=1 Tax=Dreissena polymorpha TaxID=45954 RepID=A0A9D4HQ70_DREPO|nr:hypothetical protein DPMN_051362 [Dreissena polymorpha]
MHEIVEIIDLAEEVERLEGADNNIVIVDTVELIDTINEGHSLEREEDRDCRDKSDSGEAKIVMIDHPSALTRNGGTGTLA